MGRRPPIDQRLAHLADAHAGVLAAARGLVNGLDRVTATGRLEGEEERAIAAGVLRLTEALQALSRELAELDRPITGGGP